MLKKRMYLKENGKPRIAIIDAGLMREDGFIYKKGLYIFAEELGIKKMNKETIGIGKKITLGRPPVEAFNCPFCNNVMLQNKALRQDKENDFIFLCETCKRLSKVTLNNIECTNCKCLVKTNKAFLEKFCSINCYNTFYNKVPNSDILPKSNSKSNNCLHCIKGYCKNDENRYYYDKKCPGDCDYYQRK